MKKKYNTPDAEIICVSADDIMGVSANEETAGEGVTVGWENWDNWGK